jgi:hypothetical protein
MVPMPGFINEISKRCGPMDAFRCDFGAMDIEWFGTVVHSCRLVALRIESGSVVNHIDTHQQGHYRP